MATTTTSSQTIIPSAKYDLTSQLCPYLDRHFLLPLLDFLLTNKMYSETEMYQAKLDIFLKTNMVDSALEIYNFLHEAAPEDIPKKRQDVLEKLAKFQQDCVPFTALFKNPEVLAQVEKFRDASALVECLTKNYGFQPESFNTVYDFAKFQYECGNYQFASEYLFHFRVLSLDTEKNVNALWGKLACDILIGTNWETALDDLWALKDIIDPKEDAPMTRDEVSPVLHLQQRSWLIHWGLFVFFNHPKGREYMIDMCFEPNYSNAIQTACPHILRYLTAAVITSKHRRTFHKDNVKFTFHKELIKLIQQETYSYRDPITEFMEALYVKFDFEEAQQKLKECEQVLVSDYFLQPCSAQFIESARHCIFETYCRIHNTISISMLAERLNMPLENAEAWIVNLIRQARLDAAIDSKEGTVVMATQVPSIYHQVIEKTKALHFRGQSLPEEFSRDRRKRTDRDGGRKKGDGR